MRHAVNLIGSVVPSILLGGVLVVIAANVFSRTVLDVSFGAANELSVVAFSLAIWFGVIGANVSGQLIGVTVVVGRLPMNWQRITKIVSHLSLVAICGFVIQASYIQVLTSHFTTYLSLGWPKWIVPAALLVSMGFFMAFQFVEIFKLIWKYRGDSWL